MASGPAGKFQDHYQVLGVPPTATSEVIQQAYQKLSRRYHVNNRDTGDAAKFKEVSEAYEILSDPVQRRTFDAVKLGAPDEPEVSFSGDEFFRTLSEETVRRVAILCLLYDRRRVAPFTPSVSMRQMEAIVQGTPEELSFSIWYLKQREFVSADDRSALQITVEGMDYLTANLPEPRMVAPFLKGTPGKETNGSKPAPAASTVERLPGGSSPEVSAALALVRDRFRPK